MEMDCYAPKAVQGQMMAQAMGRRNPQQIYSTSVEDLFNRVPAINLVNPYINRLVRC